MGTLIIVNGFSIMPIQVIIDTPFIIPCKRGFTVYELLVLSVTKV